MDTLLDAHPHANITTMNDFSSNLIPCSMNNGHHRVVSNGSSSKLIIEHPGFNDSPVFSVNSSTPVNASSSDPSFSSSNPGSPEVEPSEDNAFLKFIDEMLMEEDLEGKTCMFQDCMALQAAEKSFYEALNGQNHGQSSLPVVEYSNLPCLDRNISPGFPATTSSSLLSGSDSYGGEIPLQNHLFHEDNEEFSNFLVREFSRPFPTHVGDPNLSSYYELEQTSETTKDETQTSIYHHKLSPVRKNRDRQDDDDPELGRNSKHTATCTDLSEQLDMFDLVLLCDESDLCQTDEVPQVEPTSTAAKLKGTGNRSSRGKKKDKKSGLVDLTGLLTQCAQAVANYDYRSASDVMKQIRQHSSPHGDGTQRLAHYFANGLEARLTGTSTEIFSVKAARTPAAEILKAYYVFVKACPFKKMSNFFANRTIGKLARSKNATKLHIIDFGILYGFQWPCLIHRLSVLPGGPPKLRITGIDFPQPGFRPSERVEETGRRLQKYCERYGVPFEYIPIAQKWETIKLEDLRIEKDELIVVNCLYRLKDLFDESVVVSSPRDLVLNLIRMINPELFIHGVVNGTYNAPFFLTRFKEALFHYSALYDMYETTIPREEPERILYEKEIFGRDAINTIACEGVERIDRPETYKQWQVRNKRAGFKQVSLNKDILNTVKAKVKTDYHKDFLVDDDGKWLFQGWKGRIIYALSCWKPAPIPEF